MADSGSEWTGRVVRATLVPEPRRKGAKDPFRGDRRLVTHEYDRALDKLNLVD
jgi:hypothetical protein